MQKAQRSDYQSAILGAFDKQPICTITDVNKHLKEVDRYISYQSTRRTLIKMCSAGLVAEMPQRGDKNVVFYTKAMFNHFNKFVNPKGEVVSLTQFLVDLEKYNADLLDSRVMTILKSWMFDAIGASVPEAYTAKNKEVPNPVELKKKIDQALVLIRELHAFLKAFTDNKIWDEHGQQKLAKEFEANELSSSLAAIVDRTWMENAAREDDS